MFVVRRTFLSLLVAALLVPLLATQPAAADAAPVVRAVSAGVGVGVPHGFVGQRGGDGGRLPVVVETTADGWVEEVEPPGPEPVSVEVGRPGWEPVVVEAVVADERGSRGRVGLGGGPVSVELPGVAADRAREVSARANVLSRRLGGQLSPYGAAVSFDLVGVDGVAVGVDGGLVLSFDLSDVVLSEAGSGLERLSVTRFVGCELFEGLDPELGEAGDEVLCDGQDRFDDVTFDVESRVLSVVVDVAASDERIAKRAGVDGVNPEKAGRRRVVDPDRVAKLRPDGNGRAVNANPDNNGVPGSNNGRGGENGNAGGNGAGVVNGNGDGVAGFEGGSSRGPAGSGGLAVVVGALLGRVFGAQAGSGGGYTVYGVSSSVASSAGDYSALPFPQLTEASVGLFSGAAETSYPIRVPGAAAGPEPSVALVYSSAGVDGYTANTNAQSGDVGIGWSLAAGGSINRGLRSCNIGGSVNAVLDKCLSSAPDDVYTLSLAGRSSTLVRVDGGNASSFPKEFRLESDPFWRVRLHRGGGDVDGLVVSTPDRFDEWWSVETPEGLTYTFGTHADSVDWVPVYDTSCSGHYYGFCDRAYSWNVDTVEDAYGNQMRWEYRQEKNWYASRGQFKQDYIRQSHLSTIEYGSNVEQGKAANARVVFDYEWRCLNSNSYANCSSLAHFYDTPTDLWCGPHTTTGLYPTTCTENAPTFWTHLRLAGIMSQVADGNGWVTVENHDPYVNFLTAPGWSAPDTEHTMVIGKVEEFAIASEAGDPYQRYGFNQLHASDAKTDGWSLGAWHDTGSEQSAQYLRNNQSVIFEDVWLGDANAPANELALRFSAYKTGSLEVRLGSETGTLIGTFTFSSGVIRPGRQDFQLMNINITPTHGVHDIYLVPKRGNTQHFMFVNHVQFGRSAGYQAIQGSVRFETHVWEPNRLNHPAGTSAMVFPRMETLKNQAGGITTFEYGQDLPCAAGVAVPPGSWDNNHLDCFPQWDTSSSPAGFTIFNKWPVQKMTIDSSVTPSSPSPDVVTTYEYVKAGWGFSDNPDSSNDTWSDFRGYNKVTVTDADGKTEHRFHQGLHGEHMSGGGTNTETVTRSDGTTFSDHYALRGMAYETRRLTAGGSEITRNWTTYTNTTTKAGFTDRDDPRFVAPSATEARVDQTASTKTVTTYNSWGQPTAVNEQGNTASGSDNRTTVIAYYQPTTSTTLGAWRGTMPCVTAVRNGNSTAAPSASSANGFDRHSQVFYDGQTSETCNRQVTKTTATSSQVSRATSGRLKTTYRVDSRGRVDRVTNPRGYSTTTTFDTLHGQVTGTTNALSWATSVGYDLWRRPTTATNVNGRTTTTVFDRFNRVVEVREPQDNGAATVKFTYEQLARPAWVQTERRLDGNDYTNSVAFFDGFGRTILTRTLAPAVGQNWATAADFDAMGRQRYVSGQFVIGNDNVDVFEFPTWGTVPTFTYQTYDAASRPTQTQTRKGVGGTVSTVFFTTTGYSGFTTTFTDRNNQNTTTTVDGLGRTVQVAEQAISPAAVTNYVYSPADDLEQVTAPDGFVTTIGYDVAGRKTSMSDPDTGDWTYGYDVNSNLTTQTDPSGTVLTFTFDQLDRITTRSADGVLGAQWFYDFNSTRRGGVWDERQLDNGGQGTVLTRTFYDDDMRVTQTRTLVPEPNSSNMYRFRSVYSLRSDGQPSQISHPSNTWYAYSYQVGYDYNPRTGQPEGLNELTGGETIIDTITRTAAGQVTAMTYGPAGADGVASWTYDPHTLRLTEALGGTTSNAGAWQDLAYTYDGNGNITSIFDDVNANQWQCFAYDELDRLIEAFTDNTSTCNGYTATGAGNYNDAYAYSVGGNIVSKTGNGTYTYGDPDHRHAVTATSDGSVYSYDDNGNMTTRNPAGSPVQTLTWDKTQRLRTVTDTTGTTEFLYDVDGQRVRRKTGDTYTFYADGIEYEFDDATNTGTFTWYHQIAGRTVAYTKTGSTTTWMFQDQINSTGLTRTDAGVNSVQRYTPWGELRTNGNLTTDRHYTGQIADTSTGLAYYNARYYDPTIGRFVSPDTIVPNIGNGQEYNRYAYVTGNPVRYQDPTGNCQSIDENGGCVIWGNGWRYESKKEIVNRRGDVQYAELLTRRSGKWSPLQAPTSGQVDWTCVDSACDDYDVLPDISIMEEMADEILGMIEDQEVVGSMGGCLEGEFNAVGSSWQGQACSMTTADGVQYTVIGVGKGASVGESSTVGSGVLVSGTRHPTTGGSVSACIDVSAASGVGGGAAFCTPIQPRTVAGQVIAEPDFENWSIELFAAFGTGRSGSASIQGSVTYVHGDNPLTLLFD